MRNKKIEPTRAFVIPIRRLTERDLINGDCFVPRNDDNSQHGTGNLKPGIWNLELELATRNNYNNYNLTTPTTFLSTWNLKFGTWNLEPEHETRNKYNNYNNYNLTTPTTFFPPATDPANS